MLSMIGANATRMRSWMAATLALMVLLAGGLPCFAHVGSPDVYFQGAAGPYHLIVTVRTPQMIPGVATVEVLSATPGITKISVVPTYIVGPGAKYPPEGDVLTQAKEDPQYFAGKIWLMESGSWEVRLKVDGAQGPGELGVPVPAAARSTLPMERGMGVLLFALMALLVAAFIAIMGAATREAAVMPREPVPPRNRRRARIAMGVATAIVLLLLFGGNAWWDSEAVAKARSMIYAAPTMVVTLRDDGRIRSTGIHDQPVQSRTMTLQMLKSSWHSTRPETVMTALIPDHGYLMHLFLVREPWLDVIYHLHPKLVETANSKRDDVSETFEVQVPSLQEGRYQLYADVVRASGFPDTMTAEIDIPETAGAALAGDDSGAYAPPIGGSAVDSARAVNGPDGPVFSLPDGYKMVWIRGTAPIVASQFVWLKFRLEDPQSKPVTDGEPYMGMAGHAEIVSEDRSVFAHIHPDGSPAMAAVEMANATTTKPNDTAAMPGGMDPNMKMPMDVMTGLPSAEVSFPYGFPKAGRYRLFVQMKRGGVIETGVFDTDVVAATTTK
jgi:hypothetical protein